MEVDRRGDILTGLIYDSALISRIHEMYTQFVRSFSRRGDVGVIGDRFIVLSVYYVLSRIIHKSGLTPGEELVPNSACKSPRTARQRVRLLVASLAIPFVKDIVLPSLDRESPSNITTFLRVIMRLLSDGYFFLNSRARTASVIEDRIFPTECIGDSKTAHVRLPSYIFKLAGIAVIVKCIEDVYGIISRNKQKLKPLTLVDRVMELDPASDSVDKPSCGDCAICMCQIDRPAAGICGHVFCWECSMSWGVPDGKPCPICRTVSRPQDLLPLADYAPSKAEWNPFWTRPFILDR